MNNLNRFTFSQDPAYMIELALQHGAKKSVDNIISDGTLMMISTANEKFIDYCNDNYDVKFYERIIIHSRDWFEYLRNDMELYGYDLPIYGFIKSIDLLKGLRCPNSRHRADEFSRVLRDIFKIECYLCPESEMSFGYQMTHYKDAINNTDMKLGVEGWEDVIIKHDDNDNNKITANRKVGSGLYHYKNIHYNGISFPNEVIIILDKNNKFTTDTIWSESDAAQSNHMKLFPYREYIIKTVIKSFEKEFNQCIR